MTRWHNDSACCGVDSGLLASCFRQQGDGCIAGLPGSLHRTRRCSPFCVGNFNGKRHAIGQGAHHAFKIDAAVAGQKPALRPPGVRTVRRQERADLAVSIGVSGLGVAR